jgi:hypothetical protein
MQRFLPSLWLLAAALYATVPFFLSMLSTKRR